MFLKFSLRWSKNGLREGDLLEGKSAYIQLGIPIRGHPKNRREGERKKCDRVGGKNKPSGRGTVQMNREGVGRGNF